jgi:predicted nucleic acid-binding protein
VILVDTSVWVDHLRRGNRALAEALEVGVVATHPFVIGELACGTIRRRAEVLSLLARLDTMPVVDNAEARGLVEERRLMGRGIGWVDVHLLASSLLTRAQLWSLDRRLASIARELGVALGS